MSLLEEKADKTINKSSLEKTNDQDQEVEEAIDEEEEEIDYDEQVTFISNSYLHYTSFILI